MVSAGQGIQPGALVARLIAAASPSLVTAFVAERDRAFVAVGAEVRVELDQFPFGEFGSVGAKITRITPEAVDALDLSGFEAMFTELLECGAVLSFFEYETARRVECFGAVAHVLSSYETKRAPEALTAFGRGINSIQLLWTGDEWTVLSLLWDEGLPTATQAVTPLEVFYGDAA